MICLRSADSRAAVAGETILSSSSELSSSSSFEQQFSTATSISVTKGFTVNTESCYIGAELLTFLPYKWQTPSEDIHKVG